MFMNGQIQTDILFCLYFSSYSQHWKYDCAYYTIVYFFRKTWQKINENSASDIIFDQSNTCFFPLSNKKSGINYILSFKIDEFSLCFFNLNIFIDDILLIRYVFHILKSFFYHENKMGRRSAVVATALHNAYRTFLSVINRSLNTQATKLMPTFHWANLSAAKTFRTYRTFQGWWRFDEIFVTIPQWKWWLNSKFDLKNGSIDWVDFALNDTKKTQKTRKMFIFSFCLNFPSNNSYNYLRWVGINICHFHSIVSLYFN